MKIDRRFPVTDISKYKKIHCIGIGGIGLSAVAEILEDNGHIVSGSDMKESEVTDHLEKKGIKVFYEHRAENVDGCDLLVYSAAVSSENPEMVRARELGIPTITRAEALGMIMEQYRNSIAVCGTHGKTTTTGMISLILRNAKYQPTILVGGNLPEINGNVEIGSNEYFVTEACEYMDSFLSLHPTVGVILNIDSDHLDYFKDIDHITRSFMQFAHQIPKGGILVAYNGNPFVQEVLKSVSNYVTYGYSKDGDFYAENTVFDENGYPIFDICSKGKKICTIHLSVPGEHNILNAMAAFAVCFKLGVEPEVIAETLHSFTGTHRRFDYTGTTKNGVVVIDDYAHHPTEIKATLSAAAKVKHNKLWCVFQPHTYTRTKALFKEFTEAFDNVDVLILTDIYAAREKDIYGISSFKLMRSMREKYPDREIYYVSDFEDIAKYLNKKAEAGDIIMTMGAGDVYKVGELVLGKNPDK